MTFYRDGNAIRVSPAVEEVRQIAERSNVLSYTRVRHLTTRQERQMAGRDVELTRILCFTMADYDGVPQLITNAGYSSRFQAALEDKGFKVRHKDLRQENEVFRPDWSTLKGTRFRYKQRETLEAVIESGMGRIHWATGTGKTWLIPMICSVYPKCRIVVTTKHLAVLETIYHRLRTRLPSVGIFTSKMRKLDRRVMCFSSLSLHHAAQLDPHIVIADEVHELATDVMFEKLAAFRQARMYCLSANDGDRFDRADFELEGVFGPLISSLPYAEAQEHGMVVPIHVHWRDVLMTYDPSGGKDGVVGMRHGIWRNKFRNQLIAKDAREFPEDQVLITCRTLEHAAYLKRELPEFHMCYAPLETHGERLEMYKRQGLLPAEERQMTARKLRWMREQFETGRMKKVIATTVWNRGVSFDSLQVLIRADASSSTIDDTQIPGRLSRISENKPCGLLIDYLDQFNEGRHKAANKRRSDYAKKKWQQFMPTDNETEEESLMRIIRHRRL